MKRLYNVAGFNIFREIYKVQGGLFMAVIGMNEIANNSTGYVNINNTTKKNTVKTIWWMWGERFKWKTACDVYWETKAADASPASLYKRGKSTAATDLAHEETARPGLV